MNRRVHGIGAHGTLQQLMHIAVRWCSSTRCRLSAWWRCCDRRFGKKWGLYLRRLYAWRCIPSVPHWRFRNLHLHSSRSHTKKDAHYQSTTTTSPHPPLSPPHFPFLPGPPYSSSPTTLPHRTPQPFFWSALSSSSSSWQRLSLSYYQPQPQILLYQQGVAGRSIANNIQVERHHEKTHKKKWYHIKLLFQKLFSHNNMPLLFLPLLHHPPTMPPSFSSSSSSFFLAVVALLSPSTESQRSWF